MRQVFRGCLVKALLPERIQEYLDPLSLSEKSA